MLAKSFEGVKARDPQKKIEGMNSLVGVLQVKNAGSGYTPEEGASPIDPQLVEGPIAHERIDEDGSGSDGRIENAP